MTQVHVGISGGEAVENPGDIAALAERVGFDSIWTGEHMTNFGPILSSIPVMATFASRTNTIKIGAGVVLFPLRHPTVVAKEISSLDILSEGRIILGVGVSGENPKEFEACGVDVKQRGSRTNEGLELIRKLWTGEEVTHKGRYYQMEGAVMEPSPVQKPGPPIYVAGRKEAAIKRAAIYGDGWLPYFYDPGRYRDSVDKITAAAARNHKDLSGFHWALFQFVALEETYEKALEVAIKSLEQTYRGDFGVAAPRYVALGTASQCLDRLHEYFDAGVREFILSPLTREGQGQDKVIQLADELLHGMKGF